MMYALSSLLVAALLGQAAPAATTGRIAGTVVLEDAKTPIAGAQIILLPAGRPTAPFGMPPQALTDQEGRFVFDKLAPGGYRMEVRKTGLAPLNDPGGAPTALVNAGQTTQVDLHLQKGAVIAGRILDAAGEALTDARIMAMRRSSVNASNAPRLLPAPGGGQQTNDLGEFRIAGLAAGDYVVVALPQGGPAFGGPAVTPTANGTATTSTYYPGTTDQVAAQTIHVAAGETVNHIVFSMQSAPAFRVSGQVVDESGAPVGGAMVMLMGDPRSNAFMGPIGNARTGDDGRFTIGAVPGGAYRVTASVPVMMGGAGAAVGSGIVGGGIVAGVSGAAITWSIGGTTSGVVGGGSPPTEVTVNGADVVDVRVVTQRPIPR